MSERELMFKIGNQWFSPKSIQAGVERLVMYRRKTGKAIDKIEKRIYSLEREIERDGDFRRLQAEISGLEYALKVLRGE